MLTAEQKGALEVVAKAFGWDRMPLEDLALMMWASFHYYVRRLNQREPMEK